jgi:hypothetical protein
MNNRKYEQLLADYERDRLKRSAREARGIYRPYHFHAPDWLYDLAFVLAFVGILTAIATLLVIAWKLGIIGG